MKLFPQLPACCPCSCWSRTVWDQSPCARLRFTLASVPRRLQLTPCPRRRSPSGSYPAVTWWIHQDL